MQHVKIRFARKTGFRRLWVVASALWVIIAGFLLTRFSDVSALAVAGVIVIPPVATYALAAALVWVIEGFVRADQ